VLIITPYPSDKAGIAFGLGNFGTSQWRWKGHGVEVKVEIAGCDVNIVKFRSYKEG